MLPRLSAGVMAREARRRGRRVGRHAGGALVGRMCAVGLCRETSRNTSTRENGRNTSTRENGQNTSTRENGSAARSTQAMLLVVVLSRSSHERMRARASDARALLDTRVSRQSAASVRPCAAYTAIRASTLARESAPPRAVMLPSRSPEAYTRRPLLGLEEASLPGVASVRS